MTSNLFVACSFFLIAAVAMAGQTLYGQRRGWVYCSRTERAYRNRDPRRYGFWVGVQWCFVAALTATSIVLFNRAKTC